MNKKAPQMFLLIALIAATLAGCATNATPAIDPKATPQAAATIYEAVWRAWDGEPPDERWIDTAAMLTCKQIIGGYEPRPVADHPENNELIVSAAEDYLCEVDR